MPSSNCDYSLIPQQYSWGRLVISYEAICKLFTYVQVFPAVIDMLLAFGEKTGYEDDSHSEYVFRENEDATGKAAKEHASPAGRTTKSAQTDSSPSQKCYICSNMLKNMDVKR